MTARIAIVGGGSIGSRHLQALARVDRALQVDVVDPSETARTRAMAALAVVGGLKNGQVHFHSGVGEIQHVPDVAIVATNARERREVVEELVKLGVTCLILEKVLFTKLADYDAVETLLADRRVQAWVNCGRRVFPFAERLHALVGNAPFRYRVEGTGWGLGCNLVHFLDEFSLLCGDTTFTISTAGVTHTIPAKRSGYLEFVGAVEVRCASGSTMIAACQEGAAGPRSIRVETGDIKIEMSEASRTIVVANGGAVQTAPYVVPLQSEVTGRHVEAILDGAAPNLPTYRYAAQLHRPMIAAFLARLRAADRTVPNDECPVT